MNRKVQVGIIGAGPAGLLLAHLLHRQGIGCVILESRSREAIEGTIRAGVLEQWLVDLLAELGLAQRLQREAHFHDGITLRFDRANHHIDFPSLTNGKRVTVYAQHEVIIDLVAALPAQGVDIMFGVLDVGLYELDSDQPSIRYRKQAGAVLETLRCDFIAGCDGFHGPSRHAIPEAALTCYETIYPFGWLGILTKAPPSYHELVYARHSRGFALLSTRSPSVQRLYLQCDPGDDLQDWSNDRIWDELNQRLATDAPWHLAEGEIFQKNIVALRSFVCETMRYGRLFLAGDAAHIVPPTGAKGLNLAAADVVILARAVGRFYRDGNQDRLDSYAATCLRRIWRGERYSWYMTTLLHNNKLENDFERRIHLADLDYVVQSRAAQQALAENYVGLPFDTDGETAAPSL
jgi:p-hydroxybenzoate 3-monooxygenase